MARIDRGLDSAGFVLELGDIRIEREIDSSRIEGFNLGRRIDDDLLRFRSSASLISRSVRITLEQVGPEVRSFSPSSRRPPSIGGAIFGA